MHSNVFQYEQTSEIDRHECRALRAEANFYFTVYASSVHMHVLHIVTVYNTMQNKDFLNNHHGYMHSDIGCKS